jgi:hypothetical protein
VRVYVRVRAPQLKCYQYTNMGVNDQLSDSPAVDDPNIEWLAITAYPNMAQEKLPKERWPKVGSAEVH